MGRKPKNWPIEELRKAIEQEGLTHVAAGLQLGIPGKYVSDLCKRHGIKCQRRGPRSGEAHPDWEGGRVKIKGYWHIYCPGHPKARKPVPYVPEHRLVMEKILGRYLKDGEVVHHANRDREDNRPENLRLYSSNGKHLHDELLGRCPKWTEDGKRRILAGVQKRIPTPVAIKSDALRLK